MTTGIDTSRISGPLSSGLMQLCCLLSALAAPVAAIQGVALRDGHTASLVSLPDGSTLRGFGSHTGGGAYHGCRFSPDGRQIAYIRRRADLGINEIIIMHNDGTHREKICDLYNLTLNNTTFLSWAEDGHIYWSEWDSTINRVNLLTRQREVVMVCPIPPIRMATVSRDGTRAAAQGKPQGKTDPNIIYTFDLLALTQQLLLADTVSTQCAPSISPDGSMVTRNYSCHCRGDIVHFSEGSVIHSLIPPTGSSNRYLFSSSSDDYIIYQSSSTNEIYVHKISTNEFQLVPGNCWAVPGADFWPGELPPPPSDSIWLVLDTSSLLFSCQPGATQIPARHVTVSNTASGTLDTVLIHHRAAWLTVAISGETENSRILANTVDADGLAAGLYVDTVTLSAGTVGNVVRYTVQLNVGLSLMAPSHLTALPWYDTAIRLTWRDNADNESGYAIERAVSGGIWSHIATTGADDTVYIDSAGLVYGTTYRYRVRAFRGSDSSAFSEEAVLLFQQAPQVHISEPRANCQWAVGSVEHIQWTTVSVSEVSIEYSPDNGETWILVSTDGAVTQQDERWGNYPWTIPDNRAEAVLITVYQYGDKGIGAISETFSIVASLSSICGEPAMNRHMTITPMERGMVLCRAAAAAHGGSAAGQMRVFRPNGALVTCVNIVDGVDRILWDGRNRQGCSVAGGGYIVRLVSPAR